MPSSRLPRVARLAALSLLAIVAACRIGGDPPYRDPQPRISLSVEMLDAGDSVTSWLPNQSGPAPARVVPAGGLVNVRGYLWPGTKGGRVRRVDDGQLVINGTAIDGRIPPRQQQIEYVGEIAGRPADGVVTIALPRIEGIAPVTLRLEGLARTAGAPPVLSGGELRLRVVVPSSRIEPPLMAPRWTVVLSRDGRTTSVDGFTVPSPDLVFPVASILPGTGPVSARLLYYLNADSYLLRPTPSESTYTYSVSLVSSLRFAPVAP